MRFWRGEDGKGGRKGDDFHRRGDVFRGLFEKCYMYSSCSMSRNVCIRNLLISFGFCNPARKHSFGRNYTMDVSAISR